MNDLTFTLEDRGLQYLGATRIEGPLVVVERIRDIGYDETVEILGPDGRPRIGRVLDISETQAVVQVLEGTSGLSNQTLRIRFLGSTSCDTIFGSAFPIISFGDVNFISSR